MRLLVTRPGPDAERTAARLASLGHQAMIQPLLSISFNPPPPAMSAPAAILVTSQNSVRALTFWPQVADWNRIPVFAAGPATGRAVAALGFTDVRIGGGDSEALVELVTRDLMRGSGPLLYPAARDRAGALAGGLTARGYDVRTVEAYRADPVARLDPAVREAIADGTIDGILLYSGRTARALLALAAAAGIADSLRRPEYFVISRHVAEVVGGLGARIHVAARPDEDSLLSIVPAAG
jgi:uroporphyrinogen-III synthase